MLVAVLLVSIFSIYSILDKEEKEIEAFREQEYNTTKTNLKNIVDIAYGMVDYIHKNTDSNSYDTWFANSSDSTLMLEGEIQAMMIEEVKKQLQSIRFDNGEGYFWITDTKLPYPTMIMHAAKPQNAGKIMDGQKYNVVKDKIGKNLYQERVEKVLANGAAFVEYIMNKPGTDEIENKISYSRLHPELNWVISSGLYTDSIHLAVEQQRAEMNNLVWAVVLKVIIVSILFLIIGITLSIYFSNDLTKAILGVRNRLKDLSLGKEVSIFETKRKDEVGEMVESLNALVEGVQSYTNFSKEIGKGNLAESFTPLSEDDVLGNSLVAMRDELIVAAKENEIRNWVNEGFAKSASLLRQFTNDIDAWYFSIIEFVVNYLDANQGGIFALDTEDQFIELRACLAYNRQKFQQKKIGLNEGLVGRCVMEKKTIYMTQLPDTYITITSGLGEASPTSLILIPLKHNENVVGVIELAFFKNLESHQIEFLEKIGESIASAIIGNKNAEKTRLLLQKSQQQAEELRATEEEMRQNNEELVATQEEIKRRGDELEMLLKQQQEKEQALVEIKSKYEDVVDQGNE